MCKLAGEYIELGIKLCSAKQQPVIGGDVTNSAHHSNVPHPDSGHTDPRHDSIPGRNHRNPMDEYKHINGDGRSVLYTDRLI